MPKSSIARLTRSSLICREPSAARVEVAHQCGLGDLDRERRGVECADRERGADVGHDRVVIELAGGHVDRDAERAAEGVPGRHLLAGHGQYPAADLANPPA